MEQIKIHYGHFNRSEGLESWIMSEVYSIMEGINDSLNPRFELWIEKIKTSQNNRGFLYEIKMLMHNDLSHRVFIQKKDMSLRRGFSRLKKAAQKVIHREIEKRLAKRDRGIEREIPPMYPPTLI